MSVAIAQPALPDPPGEVGRLPGPPAALEGVGDELLAATHDPRVLTSRDGGKTWRDLLDPGYCKAKFNLGYPFLKSVHRGAPISTQRIDHRGYGRYWKRPLQIAGQEFLMCSQWFVWQRDAFDAWVRDIG